MKRLEHRFHAFKELKRHEKCKWWIWRVLTGAEELGFLFVATAEPKIFKNGRQAGYSQTTTFQKVCLNGSLVFSYVNESLVFPFSEGLWPECQRIWKKSHFTDSFFCVSQIPNDCHGVIFSFIPWVGECRIYVQHRHNWNITSHIQPVWLNTYHPWHYLWIERTEKQLGNTIL